MAKTKKEASIETIQQYAYYLCAYQLTIDMDSNIGFAPVEIVTRLDDFKFTQERLLQLRDAAMKQYLKEFKPIEVEKNKIVNCELINIIIQEKMTEEEFNAKIDVDK